MALRKDSTFPSPDRKLRHSRAHTKRMLSNTNPHKEQYNTEALERQRNKAHNTRQGKKAMNPGVDRNPGRAMGLGRKEANPKGLAIALESRK